MHGDEVHLVVQLFNQRQLVFKLRDDFFRHTAGVALGCTLPGQAAQAGSRGFLRGCNVAQRVAVQVNNFVEAKRAAPGNDQRGGQQLGRVQRRQPHAGTQVRLGVGLQRKAAVVDSFAQAYGGQYVLQRLARAHMHVNVTASDQRYARLKRQRLQLRQPQRIVQALQQFSCQPHVRLDFYIKYAFSPMNTLFSSFYINSALQ